MDAATQENDSQVSCILMLLNRQGSLFVQGNLGICLEDKEDLEVQILQYTRSRQRFFNYRARSFFLAACNKPKNTNVMTDPHMI